MCVYVHISDIRDPNIRNPDTQIHPDINNDIDNSSKDMQTNEDMYILTHQYVPNKVSQSSKVNIHIHT
jgi:hypothetical protein